MKRGLGICALCKKVDVVYYSTYGKICMVCADKKYKEEINPDPTGELQENFCN